MVATSRVRILPAALRECFSVVNRELLRAISEEFCPGNPNPITGVKSSTGLLISKGEIDV